MMSELAGRRGREGGREGKSRTYSRSRGGEKDVP